MFCTAKSVTNELQVDMNLVEARRPKASIADANKPLVFGRNSAGQRLAETRPRKVGTAKLPKIVLDMRSVAGYGTAIRTGERQERHFAGDGRPVGAGVRWNRGRLADPAGSVRSCPGAPRAHEVEAVRIRLALCAALPEAIG
jgi:hypothetical protein